jgi:hypothetical protein
MIYEHNKDATHVKGLFGKCFVTWLKKMELWKKLGFSANLSNFAKILKNIAKILKSQNWKQNMITHP